jgi:hypothetical protein
MPELQQFHPDYRRTWPDRIEELIYQFADLDEQKRKWSDRPEREAWDTFSELMCQVFEDEQVEVFAALYEGVLDPRVAAALKTFLQRVDRFSEDVAKRGRVAESVWIDSPEWKQSTCDAAAVLDEVKRWGWPPLDKR